MAILGALEPYGTDMLDVEIIRNIAYSLHVHAVGGQASPLETANDSLLFWSCLRELGGRRFRTEKMKAQARCIFLCRRVTFITEAKVSSKLAANLRVKTQIILKMVVVFCL